MAVKSKTAPKKKAATKKAPAPKAKKAAATSSPANARGKRTNWTALREEAAKGKVPQAPDFSAATHAPYRGKLKQLQEMVARRDLDGLKAFEINPVSSSPKALENYRTTAIIAIEAKAK